MLGGETAGARCRIDRAGAAGGVALDIGVHTISMAKAVAPQGGVFAFEPQRVIFQMLCGNVALNALDNVSVVMAALGNHTGTIEVPRIDYAHHGNFGGLTLANAERERATEYSTESVPLKTVDELQLELCHFVKIDVEGMEQAVIEGACATFSRCQPIIYVENNLCERSRALLDCLNRLQYRCHWHVTPLFNAKNYFDNRENIFPSLVSHNMLCVPRSSGLVLEGFAEVTEENVASPPQIYVPPWQALVRIIRSPRAPGC